MGREWYFNWGGKSSKKGGVKSGSSGGSNGSGSRSGGAKKPATPQVTTAAAAAVAAASASGGCMNAVLHIFDLQHFQFCLHPHNESFIPEDPKPPKGVEAPRNSLESIHEDEKEDSLQIPMGIQIKTNRRDTRLKVVQAPRGKVEDMSSESSCSPAAARTPTLVARLMGLDILPESDASTPRSSSSHSHISHTPHTTTSIPPTKTRKTRTKSSYNNDVPGPKSLPESPKSSSSHRRKSTDGVDQHRLSLQINKENSIVKEMESSRPSCSAINTKRREGRNYEEENKSPGYYARQIMKQVRETVSRRVGVDITNTISQREHRRDEHLLNPTTSTKKPKKGKKDSSSLSPSISSPKLRKSSDTTNKISQVTKFEDSEAIVMLQTTMLPFESENSDKKLKHEQHKCSETLEKFENVVKSNTKVPPKSFESIRNKKEEQFVRQTRNHSNTDKKCKKTPLSSELVHSSVPPIVPLKKETSSNQVHTKLLEKQGSSSKVAQISKPITSITSTGTTTTRLSRGPSQVANDKVTEEATHISAVHTAKECTSTSTTSTNTSLAELQYISRILKCTGVDRDTPISFTRWFSPSNPLDPTIYHTLEASHYNLTTNTTNLDHSLPYGNYKKLSINRKLLFHLVDEMLAHILKPYIKVKPWSFSLLKQDHHHNHQQINGFQLVKTLCTKIRSFPSANCQTLQDIDALVEKDLPRIGAASDSLTVEEEAEAIVVEIEHDIMGSLIQEMAVFCYGSRSS